MHLHRRQVSLEEAQKLAINYNLTYIETSAKLGTNIDETYVIAAQKIIEKIDKKLIDVMNDKYGVKVGLQNGRSSSSFPTEIEKKEKCCGS
jgi:hypothetical protein